MKQGVTKLGLAVVAAALGAVILLLVAQLFFKPSVVKVVDERTTEKTETDNQRASYEHNQDTAGKNNGPMDTKEVILSFFGDLMLDRSVRQHIEKKGIDSIFAKSENLYKSADYNIANLEGPVADFSSKSVNTTQDQPGHFSFVLDPKNLTALQKRGFTIVNLGNNHILNFGQSGLQQTKENLLKNNIQYFGDPGNNNYLLLEKNGVKIALISYNQFRSGSADIVSNQLTELRSKADLVVVYTHWGVEYQNQPGMSQKNLAHQWVDAGADAVIGSHPHVMQSIEKYKGKYIFYSLGNFVFDQFFSAETKKGLDVVLQFDGDKDALEFKIVPIAINGGFELQPLGGDTLISELHRLADISDDDQAVKTMIISGNLR